MSSSTNIWNDYPLNVIASKFFNRNFGQASKSEIELLMFHLYMEHRLKNKKSTTDYSLSKELGITQQRIRNLRIKEQLVYPREIDWKEYLAKQLDNARYDDPLIVIDIPDPNVLIEIKNHLEESGKYVRLERNSRLLSMRIEFFLDLAIEIDEQKDSKTIYSQLLTSLAENNKLDEKGIHPVAKKCDDILSYGADITTIIANLASILSPGNIVFDSIRRLAGGIR